MNARNGVLGLLVALAAMAGCYGTDEVGGHVQSCDVEEPGPVCEASDTTIFAGQHIDAGNVSVGSDGTDLIFTITGDNGWQVSEYHIYAGRGAVPVNNAGAPAPGQFPYTDELDDPIPQVVVRVPLADLEGECGDVLNVAVHTVMVLIEDGQVVDTQTGWGFGPNEFRRQWGWWYTVEICCDQDLGCVRGKGPWREIPAIWPVSEMVLGGVLYDAYGLVDILYTGPEDESIDLAHQLIAARLNEAAGAYVDAQTAADMAAAAALLDANVDSDSLLGYGIFPGDPAFADFEALRNALWDFNNGLRDAPTCDPEWLAAQPLP